VNLYAKLSGKKQHKNFLRPLSILVLTIQKRVIICSRNIGKCESTAHELKRIGVRSLAIQCDISSDEDVDRLVSETVKRFQRIDILINK